jgi:CheY-like chemotaxis protein
MRSRTILVVEDDLALADAIVTKLMHVGFTPVSKASGEAAITWMENSTPDFIWLDMLLPGMSGIDFLEYLRKHEQFREIPVLMVSVFTGPEKIKRAFELNIIDFVSKSDHDIKDVVGQVSTYFARGETGSRS